jgi:ketosteroid isomerase-like protein
MSPARYSKAVAEHVELVKRIYDAWDREQSARDFISEDVEYVNPSYAVEPGIRQGRSAFRAVRDTYEDYTLKVDEFIDAGHERVVVLARYTGTGRASRIRIEGEQGFLWTVRDGQAIRFQWFQSHREALEAAGLPE